MLYEHIDTAVIDGESLPWVPFTPYSENILLKYFKLDPIRGEWIVLMKAPIDMQLPRHHHTGTVMVYTLEGKWKYKEHDWVAGPGSLVYETAASTHTPEVVSGRRRRICGHTGSGDRRSLVPRRERQHRRARKLEDLAAPLSRLLRAAWHQAERPHGVQLITATTSGTTP